ncbi:MAG: DUF188 domain-containing protein [Syntrophomonadaceae bacterium]|nr:DUF188 domain-containing protein [Syntrophomonadaceae bacterium]
MKIIVDADGCPRTALQICFDLGSHYSIAVWTVASFNHHINSSYHLMVGNSPQEADLKIVNITTPADVVITQDWGLAALILGKGATCISPSGRIYQGKNMDFLLEEREIKARYRRSGGRTKGPKKRTPEDDRRFKGILENLIKQKLKTE